jgi:NADH-quinone oxidoreductase subunit N
MGFWAKFEIFTAALAAQTADESWWFLLLAVIGVLNAAVGAYYYLRIVVLMYLSPAPEREPIQVRGGWPVAVAVGACASLTVALGLFWTPVAATARSAARAAAAHPAPVSPRVEIPEFTAAMADGAR